MVEGRALLVVVSDTYPLDVGSERFFDVSDPPPVRGSPRFRHCRAEESPDSYLPLMQESRSSRSISDASVRKRPLAAALLLAIIGALACGEAPAGPQYGVRRTTVRLPNSTKPRWLRRSSRGSHSRDRSACRASVRLAFCSLGELAQRTPQRITDIREQSNCCCSERRPFPLTFGALQWLRESRKCGACRTARGHIQSGRG